MSRRFTPYDISSRSIAESVKDRLYPIDKMGKPIRLISLNQKIPAEWFCRTPDYKQGHYHPQEGEVYAAADQNFWQSASTGDFTQITTKTLTDASIHRLTRIYITIGALYPIRRPESFESLMRILSRQLKVTLKGMMKKVPKDHPLQLQFLPAYEAACEHIWRRKSKRHVDENMNLYLNILEYIEEGKLKQTTKEMETLEVKEISTSLPDVVPSPVKMSA